MSTEATELERLATRLAGAGFPAAELDSAELLVAAHGNKDLLDRYLARRLNGEPIEWITGVAMFLGGRIAIDRGVFVPRQQSEALAELAIALLPEGGLGVDLCTGSGAIVTVMMRARPTARVLASDIDPAAVSCAQRNGVEVFSGHLADPLPTDIYGRIDVVIGVVPYVPSEEMAYLPRDVREFEPRQALDGGPGGLELLIGAVRAGAALLHLGGSLLLEVGGNQDHDLEACLAEAGYSTWQSLYDQEGDLRGMRATY